MCVGFIYITELPSSTLVSFLSFPWSSQEPTQACMGFSSTENRWC